MKLVIGGYAQGKLNYVLQKYYQNTVYDSILPQNITEQIIINHFHNWVKNCIKNGGCPEKEISEFLEKCNDCIIISNEIGNGIVPIDSFEREYRERTGRILIQIAEKAEEVERVICGIGQRIK